MTLEGKGFYIWQVHNCEQGDTEAIVQTAISAGITHVLIKVCDGIYPYNYDWKTKVDVAKPVVQALRDAGLTVWGWGFVYGEQAAEEANIAIRRIKELELDGFAIDAEGEYENPTKKKAAAVYMNELRKQFKEFPIALSSYRFPSYHPRVPWREFLGKCDFNMPQVYWMKSHNPGEQLRRCIREFQEIVPFRPIIPTGSAFSERSWTPTAPEILEFLQTAQSLNLRAANFWSWDYCREHLPNLWNTIAHYPWFGETEPEEMAGKLINALNSGVVEQILGLYHPDAVHITAERTLQGSQALGTWYQNWLTQTLTNAEFKLTSTSGTGNLRQFTWSATSSRAMIQDGNDTLGLLDGKISYHFSSYHLDRSEG